MVAPSAANRHVEGALVDRKLFVHGPAGRLEARLRGEAIAAPFAAALLLHPHPLHGGSLDNKTLFRLAKSLEREVQVLSLRINFRGVGASDGEYGGGRGEGEDAKAALHWLSSAWPNLPLVGIGYSFGAAVGLAAIADSDALATFVALGFPLTLEFAHDWLRRSPLPGLFVQGEADEFGDCAQLRRFLKPLGRAHELRCIAGADHLFRACEDRAVAAVVQYIGRKFGPSSTGS
jgi:alpha/beta superfamily hydrolase